LPVQFVSVVWRARLLPSHNRQTVRREAHPPKRGLSTIVVTTAGYRAATDKYAAQKKVRFPREQVVEYV